jgi:hypothetical protein
MSWLICTDIDTYTHALNTSHFFHLTASGDAGTPPLVREAESGRAQIEPRPPAVMTFGAMLVAERGVCSLAIGALLPASVRSGGWQHLPGAGIVCARGRPTGEGALTLRERGRAKTGAAVAGRVGGVEGREMARSEGDLAR